MGHLFTDKGLKADPAKVEAIQKCSLTTDVNSARRFFWAWPTVFLVASQVYLAWQNLCEDLHKKAAAECGVPFVQQQLRIFAQRLQTEKY